MDPAKEKRIAITVRFPRELLEQAKTVVNGRQSFNDFVVRAVEQEVRRRRATEIMAEIDQLREEIKAKHGLLPDSVPLIRQLREGIGRRG